MPKNNRIFISFAAEDSRYRDFLVGQAKNAKTPFAFVDMSVKEPWDSNWKTNCRTQIKGCDGLIALITKNTVAATGARWEIQCAVEEKVPVIGVQVDSNAPAAIPAELKGKPVIAWTWTGIAQFINGL